MLLSKHSELLALSAFPFGGARASLVLPGRAAKNTALNLSVPLCEVGSVTGRPFLLSLRRLAALIITARILTANPRGSLGSRLGHCAHALINKLS